LLTRVIHGGRISLTVGAIAVVISVVIALFFGMTAGFFGGMTDNILMRFTDFVMSIPFLPMAITLSAVVRGKVSEMNRIYMMMVIMGFLMWPGLARLVRAQILLEREKDFVLAARALGVRYHNIIVRHILPNIFNLVLVNITLAYAGSLLTEAGLSYLGFGVAPPTPSWGNILQNAQSLAVIEYYWWRWLIPGTFVVLAALCINLVGDALREAMDPRASEK
jgi:peptide/nickel transport system permease protein